MDKLLRSYFELFGGTLAELFRNEQANARVACFAWVIYNFEKSFLHYEGNICNVQGFDEETVTE